MFVPSIKSDKNGSSKTDEKPPPSASSVTQDREREGEPTESTPMIQGEGGDKAAIMKEEEAAAKAAQKEGLYGPEAPPPAKDSPV